MTSGRTPCSDCGRNSTQGRHAACHVLAILRHAGPDGTVSKTELLRTVYPYRWAQFLPGERPDLSPIDGAIRTLRNRGHRLASFDRTVSLRESRP